MVDHTMNPDVDSNSVIDNLQQRLRFLEDIVTKIGYDTKASKKRRFKSKSVTTVLRGLTKALCVETIDPWKQNRVRFYHPLLHDPLTPLLKLPFASPVSNMGGFDDCGMNWVPPAGSTLVVFFEGGARDAGYYIGTTWSRDRGPGGSELPVPSREWEGIYKGHRKGYFHGPGPGDPNDEHQSLPPWNTENYNSLDIDRLEEFTKDENEQLKVTFPHIYGFKTPEKHMLKMVDGNAKCNRRWKRLELMSGCGNWMIFKDDHLHYGGQWAHPECPPDPGGGQEGMACSHKHRSGKDGLFFTDIIGKPVEGADGVVKCGGNCLSDCDPQQCSRILQDSVTGDLVVPIDPETGRPPPDLELLPSSASYSFGHSSTPGDPPDPPTKYKDHQTGSNRSFKHQNECRPYKGPGTPQNNKCQLPQSGIQFLSLSGHTFCMDDSVEEPRGKPEWERSTQNFDFGCNDKYQGVLWMKSATGHAFTMSDVEEPARVRGWKNFMEMRSGNGSFIQLNDETIRTQTDKSPCEGECQECPPDHAGPRRGVHIFSTSNHKIRMIDHLNLQCGPCRQEGGVPEAKATKAYMQFQSGYGLEMRFNDDFSQEETQQQWIQILHPQCVDPDTDQECNSCEECECRGPHIMRFQGRPKGVPGMIFLRAGGHYIKNVYDSDVTIVGDLECNPSDKFTYVSRKFMTVSEDVHFRYSGELHIFFAEKQILLMAGRDCPPPEGQKCKVPCLYNVIVARCPVLCPITKMVHWTEKAMSERVFASAYHPCQVPCGGGNCSEYFDSMANAQGKGCREIPSQTRGGPDEPEEDIQLPTS